MAVIPKISGSNRLAQLVLGQDKNLYVRSAEYNKLVDRVNSLASSDAVLSATLSFTGPNTHTGAETHTGVETHSGAETHSGNEVFSGYTSFTSYMTTGKAQIRKMTATAVNSTGAGTLAVVTAGVLGGLISSTSAAGVTVTLDSVANMITAAGLLGVTLAAGSNIQFFVDNSAGSNTVTVAVDSGATLAVATPVITGGATLTIGTVNKIGLFNIYFTSATAGILSRII